MRKSSMRSGRRDFWSTWRAARSFARSLGAVWAGSSQEQPPEPLDAAIIFAPVGDLVPTALSAVRKGGVVVCGGIHMSDIPSFPYRLLWEERQILSVANLTRQDAVASVHAGFRAQELSALWPDREQWQLHRPGTRLWFRDGHLP